MYACISAGSSEDKVRLFIICLICGPSMTDVSIHTCHYHENHG